MVRPLEWIGFFLLAAACLFSGCETTDARGPQARARRAEQVPLEGTSILFDGAVEMKVTVAAFQLDEGLVLRRDRAGPRGRRGPGEEFGTSDPLPPPRGGMISSEPAPSTHRIRVSFTNVSAAAIQFDVYEVRSVLGVFGVRPNRIKLGPNETISIDPMRSSLGENFEELQLAVSVRHRSKPETVNLTLRSSARETSDGPRP